MSEEKTATEAAIDRRRTALDPHMPKLAAAAAILILALALASKLLLDPRALSEVRTSARVPARTSEIRDELMYS